MPPMSTHSQATTDHDAIRRWVESRQGRPTRVRGTGDERGEGILRIDFSEPENKLEEISWDEFFETFDDRKLAFLHQDRTADGKVSRFFKFVHRDDATDADGDRATHRARPKAEREGSSRDARAGRQSGGHGH
jgi:hypothetical protein